MLKTLRTLFNNLSDLLKPAGPTPYIITGTPNSYGYIVPSAPPRPTQEDIQAIMEDALSRIYARGFWSKEPTLRFADMKVDGYGSGHIHLRDSRSDESLGYHTIDDLRGIMEMATPPYPDAPNSNHSLFTLYIQKLEETEEWVKNIRQQKTPARTAEVFQFPSLSA